MAKHSFAAYAVRIRRLRDAEELPLDDFDGAGADLLKEFYGFFLQLKESSHEIESQERSLEVDSIVTKRRALRVKIALGAYGRPSRIRERDTGEVVFEKAEDHVDLSDLRNYLILPEGATTGFFFTERLHGKGLRSVLESSFRKAFNAKHAGYTIEFSSVTTGRALAAILERGEVKGIQLVRHTAPDDIAGSFEVDEEVLGAMELILKAKRNRSFGKATKSILQEVLKGDRSASSVLEWRNVQYDELKVQVKIGGAPRTVSVTSARTPVMLYDLDEELRKERAEFTDEWVYGKAEEYAEDLARGVGVSADVMRREFEWDSSWDHYRLEVPNEPID